MQTKHQLNIDRYIARPFAWVLNFGVRLMGQILSLDHSLEREFKNIAVCKFKGMGSIIQATPMLAALRQKYPKAKITFVSTLSNKAVLDKIDLIDRVVVVDDSSLWKLIKSNIAALLSLVRNRPDVYFDLEIYSHYSVIFTAFTLSQNRIGFYLRSSSYRMGIYTHMMYYNPQVPISMVYMQMAQLLGWQGSVPPLYRLEGQLPQGFNRAKYMVINPNASDLRLERRWSKENFTELIKVIARRMPDLQIVLIGSSAERSHVLKITDELKEFSQVLNMAGETSISELIGIVDHAEFMISNDTGPMHVAFSTATPVVCLFGPCSPKQYGNFKNAYIIYKRVYCSPCVHEFEEPPCKGNNVCMQLIEIRDVMEGIEKLISNENETKTRKNTIYYGKDGDVLGKVHR